MNFYGCTISPSASRVNPALTFVQFFWPVIDAAWRGHIPLALHLPETLQDFLVLIFTPPTTPRKRGGPENRQRFREPVPYDKAGGPVIIRGLLLFQKGVGGCDANKKIGTGLRIGPSGDTAAPYAYFLSMKESRHGRRKTLTLIQFLVSGANAAGESPSGRGRPERDEGLPPRRRSSRLPSSDAEAPETIKADLESSSW
jgi:hypothetical protein